jgi:hypothetical protein
MESSINSIHFLWAAYVVVVLANLGFVLRLIRRFKASKRTGHRA